MSFSHQHRICCILSRRNHQDRRTVHRLPPITHCASRHLQLSQPSRAGTSMRKRKALITSSASRSVVGVAAAHSAYTTPKGTPGWLRMCAIYSCDSYHLNEPRCGSITRIIYHTRGVHCPEECRRQRLCTATCSAHRRNYRGRRANQCR